MLPIFITKYKKHAENKSLLLDMIHNADYTLVNNEENDDLISKTDWFVDVKKRREYWEYFYPTIKDSMNDLFDNKIKYNGWKLKNYWFQQYKQNDVHEWHWHPETFWNNVYFLELPNGTSGTEMRLTWSNDDFIPKVEEGDIITFPSIIKHRSPPNTGGRKTVIAFNIM